MKHWAAARVGSLVGVTMVVVASVACTAENMVTSGPFDERPTVARCIAADSYRIDDLESVVPAFGVPTASVIDQFVGMFIGEASVDGYTMPGVLELGAGVGEVWWFERAWVGTPSPSVASLCSSQLEFDVGGLLTIGAVLDVAFSARVAAVSADEAVFSVVVDTYPAPSSLYPDYEVDDDRAAAEVALQIDAIFLTDDWSGELVWLDGAQGAHVGTMPFAFSRELERK